MLYSQSVSQYDCVVHRCIFFLIPRGVGRHEDFWSGMDFLGKMSFLGNFANINGLFCLFTMPKTIYSV